MSVGRLPLGSSLIASVAYSPEATLEVEFRSGVVYRYYAVPGAVYDALLAADSKGSFFNQRIRSRFAFRRVGHAGRVQDAQPGVHE